MAALPSRPLMLRSVMDAVLNVVLFVSLSHACGNQGVTYRNFWAERYSTTPCGDVNSQPLGVCSSSCSALNAQNMGTYNCPSYASSCCRPMSYCSASTAAVMFLWESQDYDNSYVTESSECSLTVVPARDTCYVRFDFTDMDVQSNYIDECGHSHFKILDQAEGDGQEICGTLNHKSTLVKVGSSVLGLRQRVRAELVMKHLPHKFTTKVTQIKCEEVRDFRSSRRRAARGDEQPGAGGGGTSAAVDISEALKYPSEFNRQPKQSMEDLGYMGRMFAVSYTRRPFIRSCPVSFLASDTVIGAASCALRLGGPGVSKGLMVVHGLLPSSNPNSMSDLAQYIARHGVVVKSTVFHPMVNLDTHENDIAIFFLNDSVKTAVPLNLPVPIDDFIGLSVSLSRYNYYDVKSSDPHLTVLNDPEEVVTKILPNDVCLRESLSSVAAVTSNLTICLDITDRRNTPCEGEVGSPVVYISEKSSSRMVTLIGLFMGNNHHCMGGRSYPEPALKIINYLDFIDAATSPLMTVPPQSLAVSNGGSQTRRWLNRIFG